MRVQAAAEGHIVAVFWGTLRIDAVREDPGTLGAEDKVQTSGGAKGTVVGGQGQACGGGQFKVPGTAGFPLCQSRKGPRRSPRSAASLDTDAPKAHV